MGDVKGLVADGEGGVELALSIVRDVVDDGPGEFCPAAVVLHIGFGGIRPVGDIGSDSVWIGAQLRGFLALGVEGAQEAVKGHRLEIRQLMRRHILELTVLPVGVVRA